MHLKSSSYKKGGEGGLESTLHYTSFDGNKKRSLE